MRWSTSGAGPLDSPVWHRSFKFATSGSIKCASPVFRLPWAHPPKSRGVSTFFLSYSNFVSNFASTLNGGVGVGPPPPGLIQIWLPPSTRGPRSATSRCAVPHAPRACSPQPSALSHLENFRLAHVDPDTV